MINYMNKRGYTLVELLVVITLILTVLGIGYSLYFYAQKSFSIYEERWITQNETRYVSRFLEEELATIYSCEILNQMPVDFDDDYRYIWAEDGIINLRYSDDSGNLHNITLNEEASLSVDFIHGTDSYGNRVDNFLQFDVKGQYIDYNVINGVELRNLGRKMSITGSVSGLGLKYKSVAIISQLPEFDYSTFCVIATASYGSYQEPGVRLLRRFRDEVLSRYVWGNKFINFYYEHSGPIAKVISKNGILKFTTGLVLAPVITVAAMLLNPIFNYFCVIIVLVCTVLYIIVKKLIVRYYNTFNDNLF